MRCEARANFERKGKTGPTVESTAMPDSQPPGKGAADPSPKLTLCLAMDLKRSTEAGMRLTTKRFDRFNLSLVNQLGPHLKAVGLQSALVKFTGDGWQVMSDEAEHAAPLCCLAVILSKRFQQEISREAGVPIENVPPLRLAICWARDLPVQLLNGQRDFVGESGRHATRACQLCHDNEILIDEVVQRWVSHDFATERVNVHERLLAFPNARLEEELALHTLRELNTAAAQELDAPLFFVNTLAIIGRKAEATELAGRIAVQLQSQAQHAGLHQESVVERFSRLLSSNLDYETAGAILRDMREAGLQPDLAAYNAVIVKAQDYAAKSAWVQRMRQDNVSPDITTYNLLMEHAEDDSERRRWLNRMKKQSILPNTETLCILVDKAEDHATAHQWLRRLEREGVKPDTATFDLLIAKAEDILTAMQWLDRMFASGVNPELVTFLTVFSKDVAAIDAEDLLAWYLALPVHPPESMQRAIAAYRKSGRIKEALRLALDYPYTQTAKRIFRAHPERTLKYFQEIVENEPRHANGAYALGLALLELGQADEAQPWLMRALELAAPGPRRDELIRLTAGAEDARLAARRD